MFGSIVKGLWGGTKALAAGKAQASLGLQSPHLPAAIVRVGRFAYSTSALWIATCWYSAYANMRTEPGSGPKLVLPGARVVNSPSRPEKNPKFSSGTPSNSVPGGPAADALAKALPGGGLAGGFLPRGAMYKPGRQDQGRDGQTNPGGAIIAPGAGVVVHVLSNPNGFGPSYPVVKFNSGPYAGRMLYIGHTISTLPAGATFATGTVLSHTGRTPIGNATVPGWFEIGYADSGSPGPFGQPAPFK